MMDNKLRAILSANHYLHEELLPFIRSAASCAPRSCSILCCERIETIITTLENLCVLSGRLILTFNIHFYRVVDSDVRMYVKIHH